MKSGIICLVIMMTIFLQSPANAQTDDVTPEYIKCGAEDYLIEEYYATHPLNDMLNSFEPTQDYSKRFLMQSYVKGITVRDFLQAQNTELLPNCIQLAYSYQVMITNHLIDTIAFKLASDEQGYDPYIILVEGAFETAKNLSKERLQIDIDLGWKDTSGQYTARPPIRQVDIAMNYIEAEIFGDVDQLRQYSCLENQDDLVSTFSSDEGNVFIIHSFECSENQEFVTCRILSDFGLGEISGEFGITITLRMQDNTVCEVIEVKVDE